MYRACRFALSAPDALCTVDVLGAFDVHWTLLLAFPAAYALALVQIHLIQPEFRKQPVESPKRTEVLAERPVYQRRRDQNNQKKAHLPAEKETQRLQETWIQSQKRKACK